jgi:RNA-splicing ligase RtcB
MRLSVVAKAKAMPEKRWSHFQQVDAADQAKISRKVARLEPLICVKG